MSVKGIFYYLSLDQWPEKLSSQSMAIRLAEKVR